MEPCESEAEFENAFDDELLVHPIAIRTIEIYIKDYFVQMGYRLNADEESHILDRLYGPRIVEKIFKNFLRDGEEDPKYGHKVVYFLAILSRIYWINDNLLVSNIMLKAYSFDSFGVMFGPIFRSSIGCSEMSQIPDSSTKRGGSTMNFFLHHANKARLQFNGVRFQDLRFLYALSRHYPVNPPVFYAVEQMKPHLVLLLLRFGAKVEDVTTNLPDGWNLPKLFRHLIKLLWESIDGDSQNLNDPTKVMSMRKHPAAECANILLRAIPQIRMGEINFPLTKLEGGAVSDGSVCSHDFIRLLSEKDVVPEFVNRYLEPSCLSHLCRCVIRNSLHSSWNLPYGVHVLPLSRNVKSYLSLAHD